jgi:hypothetical protein
MKTVIALSGFFLAIAPASALKPCEELKSEIVAKLEAKGVKNYQLDIVAAADATGQNVIGSCDAGAKKITYKKGGPASEKPAASPDSAAKPPAAPKPR